jgi:hypothetical protein
MQFLSIAIARPKRTKTKIRESGGSPSISAIRQNRNIILVSVYLYVFGGGHFNGTIADKIYRLAVYIMHSRCWNEVGIAKPFGVFTHGKENWVLRISDVETGSTNNTGCRPMHDNKWLIDGIPAATRLCFGCPVEWNIDRHRNMHS